MSSASELKENEKNCWKLRPLRKFFFKDVSIVLRCGNQWASILFLPLTRYSIKTMALRMEDPMIRSLVDLIT